MEPLANAFSRVYELGKLAVEQLDNWPQALAALCDDIRGRAPENPLVLKFRTGLQLEMMPGGIGGFSILFPEIFARRVYEPPQFTFSKTPTMIDLGANVGFFSCKMAYQFPNGRIIAVEAMPEYVERLKTNIARNNLQNIQPVSYAIGSTGAPVEIEYWFTPTGYLKVSTPPPSIPSQVVQIEAISLETLFEKYNVNQCDLLKVDIEGHEYEVLCAAPDDVLRRCRQIAMEWHFVKQEDNRKGFADLQGKLKSCGFDLLPFSDLRYGEKNRPTGMLYAVRR